jgi:hypothetical protein
MEQDRDNNAEDESTIWNVFDDRGKPRWSWRGSRASRRHCTEMKLDRTREGDD